MITVITGTPGAGKTLYTIEKLLLPLVGKTVKGRDADGNEVEHPRTIYTNINGLQIDHELIDGGDNQGLRDWHKWAKPGAVIVFDEVQKVWPPRANGSKVPEDIQELDTHRHKGVDFILITQSVMNIDRHLHALGGRHLHVRRVGNMKAAIVYEWDHVSKSLQYSKSIAKHPWRYSSKVFKLYKSSELHTKVKRSTPPLLWVALLALGVAGWGIPNYISKMKEKTQGGAVAVMEKSDVLPKTNDAPKAPAPAPVADSAPVALAAAAVEPEKPKIAGCVASSVQCVCMTETGDRVEAEPGFCQSMTAKPNVLLAGGNLDWYKGWEPPPDNSPRWEGGRVTVIGTQKGWRF